ncbi:GntR family transcriptional regulator [Niastella yeongjuensis]|uniref:GntR family transcriptional regulator n=1 Tax=Niastella yeongjuensis TaxID=354355 RepID=A0A1V9EMM7_9BACT|nr:rhamnogalacturonan acetylesterase [Niastella yeongjuensis]OQP47389.1 GntR family transcriptional regulator [Niastella yeongjuensis]SEN81849.1 Lysophospholipase L1 [Niastella yeongjuensis]
MKRILAIGLVLLAAFTLPPKKKITVWLIGDSTMSIKETKYYPETGWGMPFVYFFDSTVKVDNRAQNGRSTRTFMEEGRWQPVVDAMQEGDYVFVQFGHNDEVKTKKSYTTEEVFKTNLVKYITDARSKKVNPILLTPVARRSFDSAGHITGTHDVYAQIVRNVAKENNVPLIDLDKEGQALYQQWGVEKSKLLFNQLAPGEHPNYPQGKEDNTHFSELGARMIAQIVLKNIRSLNLELAERIRK